MKPTAIPVRGRAPRVSVVMCVMGPDAVHFPQAVESVLKQTLAELELIVVERPSTTSAAELLDGFDDGRIQYVACGPDDTLVSQRNRGMAMSSADLVAVMDADDVSEPTRLERQAGFLESHPDVSVVGSNLIIIDAVGRVTGRRSYPLEHESICRAMPLYNPLAQPSVMYRREVIVEAGGYEYERHPATEDYELWCRLMRRGVRFANLEEPLVRYRVHPAGMKTSKLRGIVRGTLEIKRRHFGRGGGVRARLRTAAERCALVVPPRLALAAFKWTHYRSAGPRTEVS